MSEAQFFQTFGVMFPALRGGRDRGGRRIVAKPVPPRELPVVREALAAIEQGGYAEALARAACLLARKGEPLPLARVELKADLIDEYSSLLPPLPAKQWREIRGRQEIICRYEPEQAVQSLPKLLAAAGDRERFLTVLDRLLSDPRVPTGRASAAQRDMLQRIRALLPSTAGKKPRVGASRKKTVRSKKA